MILNEKETDSFGAERNLHYICGANGLAAIYVTTADKDTMYYAFTDYQQNLLALTDAAGKPYERYSYDPWGNRRSATDWTQSDTLTHHIINRGYTMHEHLDEFGLINMDGRVYDPKLACFLSPDPVISDAGNWLDYNRYSYAWGNPLKYCDPTGMSEEGDHQRRHAEAEHIPSTEELVMKCWYDTNVGQKKEYTLTANGYVDQYGNTLCGLPATNADLKKFDDASANNSYDTGTSTTPNTSDKETKNAEEKLDRAIEKGPDAGGVQVSAELYVVVGGGISISVGETRNGESYISLNVKVGVGIGGGVSGGAEASFATEGKKSENGMDYDPANMSGWNASAGGGYGATINGSTSLPLSKSSESKTQWSTVSSGVGVKASANISAGYNFVLFKW